MMCNSNMRTGIQNMAKKLSAAESELVNLKQLYSSEVAKRERAEAGLKIAVDALFTVTQDVHTPMQDKKTHYPCNCKVCFASAALSEIEKLGAE